jgi:hypothetical protein
MLVGIDDVSNEFVADDIRFVEINETDSFDVPEDFGRVCKTGFNLVRKVYLGYVAGNNGF